MIQLSALQEESGDLYDIHRKIDGCRKCSLYMGNEHYVPGMGTEKAKIMCIGEAPGAKEDRTGLPFIGPSGKYLDKLFASIGLERRDVYITNIVKCRPPENRDPREDEMKQCSSFLDAQIKSIQPKIIVTLGRFSLAKFCPGVTISEVHGIPQIQESGRIIFPSYHPAVALYSPSKRTILEHDFQILATLLTQLSS